MGDRLRAGISSRYVTSQLGQLSLATLWGRLIDRSALSDPIWHVNSRSGVAGYTANCYIRILLLYRRNHAIHHRHYLSLHTRPFSAETSYRPGGGETI